MVDVVGQALPRLFKQYSESGFTNNAFGLVDDSGWSAPTPSLDSRLIYVSSSTGSDSNSGLTEALPKATIAAGRPLLRNGMPDYLCLKKGDTFHEPLGPNWQLSGRSMDEPMVICAYGTGARPVIDSGDASSFWVWNANVSNIAITGLSLTPSTYNGSFEPVGIAFYHRCTDILIEDCAIIGYGTNVVFEGSGQRLARIQVRRCTIADAWSVNSGYHCQGIFAADVDSLLIDENLLDYNGWTQSGLHAVPTIFRHNVYSINNTDVLARRNLVTNTDAMQFRSGGTVIDNVCSRLVAGLTFGKTDLPNIEGCLVTCTGNAVIDGRALDGSHPAIYGYIFTNTVGGDISDNIASCAQSLTQTYAMWCPQQSTTAHGLFPVLQNISIHDNILHEYGHINFEGVAASGYGALTFNNNVQQTADDAGNSGLILISDTAAAAPAFISSSGNTWSLTAVAQANWFRINSVSTSLAAFKTALGDTTSVAGPVVYSAPTRTLASYNLSLGGANDHDAFLTEARKNRKDDWRTQYTTSAVRTYIRAGFDL